MYDIGIPEIHITKRLQSDDGRAIKYLVKPLWLLCFVTLTFLSLKT